MAKFIELLDKNYRNTLINVDNILSVVIYREAEGEDKEGDGKELEEHVRIYQVGDAESYITVNGSYEEVKQKLSQWISL